MAKITFETRKATLTVEVPDGGDIVDVCDSHDTRIPFSCRSANCGTCRMEILEGADQLLPPEDEELDVLDAFELKAPQFRLACQTKMRPGLNVVRVRPLEEEVDG